MFADTSCRENPSEPVRTPGSRIPRPLPKQDIPLWWLSLWLYVDSGLIRSSHFAGKPHVPVMASKPGARGSCRVKNCHRPKRLVFGGQMDVQELCACLHRLVYMRMYVCINICVFYIYRFHPVNPSSTKKAKQTEKENTTSRGKTKGSGRGRTRPTTRVLRKMVPQATKTEKQTTRLLIKKDPNQTS